jgi:dTDP-4-amino-4,6-dideoxygalactose transaminase
MSAYNCCTEVDSFLVNGWKVVFYHVDEKARIDIGDFTRRVTARTKVIYVIRLFGWPQDLNELLSWC